VTTLKGSNYETQTKLPFQSYFPIHNFLQETADKKKNELRKDYVE